MAFNFVGGKKYTIAGSGVSSTASTIVLTSFTLPVSGTAITMADFGDIGYGTIEPGGTRQEFISFTGVTQNANGTATLTGVVRGLKPISGYTTDNNYKISHSGGASFIISNTPGFYTEGTFKRNDEAVTGAWTFPTPTAAASPATKSYVDSLVNGGTISYDQIIEAGTAGETVAAGDLVYFDLTDNEWKKCDADTAATVENVKLGIAQGAGTNGNNITGGVLTRGLDTNQSGMSQGDLMYASNTAGDISASTGTTERVIGLARSATALYFDPNFYYTVKAGQKAALAGSSGTPSSTNKFVTQEDSAIGGFSLNAGATINGATTPVPVYQNKTDNEVYACDGNDLAALKFLGFATSNSTDGNPITMKLNGVVSGFTGLAEGEKYYVQDAVGTIGTAPGTYEVLVGVAISETQLLIQKGKRYASGTFTVTGNGDTTLTLGFRASVLRFFSVNNNRTSISSSYEFAYGVYTLFGGNRSSTLDSGSNGETHSTSFISDTVGADISVSSITDTTTVLTAINTNGDTINVLWEAEGEL